MAVYTEVSDDALAAFLADYDIGALVAFRGIAEGVENSNFSLRTTGGDFILTLYEKRVNPADLPWFLGLMDHLAEHGITCPRPVRGRDGVGAAASVRPACRDHHLPARGVAAAGAAGALRRRWGRRWPHCTLPGRATRRPAATRWVRRAGRRCWSAACPEPTACSPGLGPDWRRR